MADAFADKVALVTGGRTGIGLATAEMLAQEGSRVAIMSRDGFQGREVAQEISRRASGEVLHLEGDVGRERDIDEVVGTTVEEFGKLDFVFNNAGTEGPVAPVSEWSEEQCDHVLAINAKGPFLVMKHTIPHLTAGDPGVLVNTASFVGTVVPVPTAVLYGATKAALLSMTASVAAAHQEDGLRAYTVCPWMVDTPMLERLSGGDPAIRDQYISANPSGRVARPEDVARVVVDLFAGTEELESGGSVLVDSGGKVQQMEFPVPVTSESR